MSTKLLTLSALVLLGIAPVANLAQASIIEAEQEVVATSDVDRSNGISQEIPFDYEYQENLYPRW